jgi:hypothetical protein
LKAKLAESRRREILPNRWIEFSTRCCDSPGHWHGRRAADDRERRPQCIRALGVKGLEMPAISERQAIRDALA